MYPLLTVLHVGSRSLPLASYGVCACLGIAVAAAGSLCAARRARLDLGASIALLGIAFAAGCLGALLLHGLVQWVRLGSLEAALTHPGLASMGAGLGIAAAAAAASRWLQLPLLVLADTAVPALAAGHALGRIGCLLGGCCFGKPWQGAIALHYSDPRAPAALAGVSRHPVPLYEAAALLALSLMCTLRPARDAGSGRRLRHYVLAYAVLRLGLECLRGDDVRGVFFGGMVSAAQLIAGAVIAGCAALRWAAVIAAAWRSVLRRSWPVGLVLFPLVVAYRAAADRVERLPMARTDTILIRSGWFEMGSDDDDVAFAVALCKDQESDGGLCDPGRFSDEQPHHRVYVRGFRIDRHEVSRGAYQRCVQYNQCAPPRSAASAEAAADDDARPVGFVTQAEASRYCRWLGGRLPREAEWERAARGSSGRRFPWGDLWNADAANFARGSEPGALAPVTAFEDGASFYGLLQMAGNVWELTADHYDPRYYARSQQVDPEARHGEQIVIRGGSRRSPGYNLRAAQRAGIKPDESRDDIGFRCAYDLP